MKPLCIHFFFAIFCVEAGAYIPLFIYLYSVVFVNVAVNGNCTVSTNFCTVLTSMVSCMNITRALSNS